MRIELFYCLRDIQYYKAKVVTFITLLCHLTPTNKVFGEKLIILIPSNAHGDL